MSILLFFLDALDAIYLSASQKEAIEQYQGQTVILGIVPRIGEKISLPVKGGKLAFFEVVDVVHGPERQGRFQVNIHLKASLPPVMS